MIEAKQLRFSSREFLRLIDDLGLTGHWGWTFARDEHVWSSGLYRLLGLDPGSVRASYDLLLRMVHPEDRCDLETTAELVREGSVRDRTFRVMRPDGSMRVLSSHSEVYFGPDARPRAVAGVVLDVTDRERLAQAQAAERRRQWVIFEQTRGFIFSNTLAGAFHFPGQLFALTGLPPDEVQADPFVTVVAGEREHWRSLSLDAQAREVAHVAQPLVPLAEGGTGRFEVFTVPVRDPSGAVLEWASVTRPAGSRVIMPSDGVREGLEQAIEGRHLRAARALLDWSMRELAARSGVSLSTIRRVEEGDGEVARRSRHTLIEALRRAGIRFSFLGQDEIAVSKQ